MMRTSQAVRCISAIVLAALSLFSVGLPAKATIGSFLSPTRLGAVLAFDNFHSLSTETDCSGRARYDLQGCPYSQTAAAHTQFSEECYSDGLFPSPVTLNRGGGVTFSATRAAGVGICSGKSYRSGYLNTFKSFDRFQFGYLEVHTIGPSCGHAHWPALWLMPSGGRWMHEIDFGEIAADGLTYAIHANHGRDNISGHLKLTAACDGKSHAYGIFLAPGEPVRWFFDRREVAEAAAPRGLLGTKWFLIMDLGIASTNFSGMADRQTVPASMIVQGWAAYGLK